MARELLVDCDDARRRLVYAVISERIKQHSASVQVFAEWRRAQPAVVWIVDVLPNEIAPYMDAQMDLGGARDAEGARTQRRMIISVSRRARRGRPLGRPRRQDGSLRPLRRLLGSRCQAIFRRRQRAPPRTANGISAGRWKAARSRTSGSCRHAADCAHGDAAANVNSYGTTLRVYDPDIDAWRIQWTDPVTQNFLQMIGRAEGGDIVQLGHAAGRPTDPLELFGHHRQIRSSGAAKSPPTRAQLACRRRVHCRRAQATRDLSHRSADAPSLASPVRRIAPRPRTRTGVEP